MDTFQEHYEWLVQARTQNQQLLLRLYRFSEAKSKVLREHKEGHAVFGLLVGAAFSLWRAAFLTEVKRTPSEILDNARKVLKMLVEDNAITYQWEKRTKEWMGGYYLNSARFRLARAVCDLRRIMPSGEAQDPVKRFQELDEREISEGNLMEAWDVFHSALVSMLDQLEQGIDRQSNEPETGGIVEPPHLPTQPTGSAGG